MNEIYVISYDERIQEWLVKFDGFWIIESFSSAAEAHAFVRGLEWKATHAKVDELLA